MNLLEESKVVKFLEAATTGDFPNLLRSDFQDILLGAYGTVDQPLLSLCDVVTSNREQETYRGLKHFQDLRTEVPEGSEYGEILVGEKDTVVIYNRKYGGLLSVTDEMVMYVKLAEFHRLASMLGEGLARNVEYQIATVIENTANTAAASGAPLTLNRVNLEAVINQYKKQTATAADGSTVKLGLVPDVLLIPPDLEYEARRLLQSTLIPGSANNDINVLNGSLRIVVSHYLTSTSAWYVLKSKWANGLKFQRVIGPPPELSVQDIRGTNQPDSSFRYDKITYKARMLFGVGVIDPVWAISSAG
jgi:hypothetical protein